VGGGVALSQDRVDEKSLKMELSTPAASLCPGGTLELEMQITNESQQVIRIDRADLWGSFSYGAEPVVNPDGSGSGTAGGGDMKIGNYKRVAYVTIPPGETFWTKYSFKLDKDFFREAGKYTLKTYVTYELEGKIDLPADSNEIEFEVFECTSK